MAERLTAGTRTGDVAGAVGDLGVLVPLAAALVLVNGLDPTAVLVGAGLLVVASGLAFRIPFPVQPLKALTAVAVAQGLSPEVIHAAGLEMAVVLLLLSVRGVADRVARAFTHTVVRALQAGVGALLVLTAARLVIDVPAAFAAPASPWPLVLGAATFAVVAWVVPRGRFGLAPALLAGGTVAAWAFAGGGLGEVAPRLPSPALPPLAAFGPALVLLVVPQLPLTLGNAVVAVSDLSREYFGLRAARVTPSRVCLSAGLGNAASAVLGGMPMCHGAGGLTAHVRLGARTARMNVFLGSSLLAVGVLLGPSVPALVAVVPVWILAGFLAYAGVRHAALAFDLRGRQFAVALAAAAAGVALGNLAVTAGLALGAAHAPRVLGRVRIRSAGTAAATTTARR